MAAQLGWIRVKREQMETQGEAAQQAFAQKSSDRKKLKAEGEAAQHADAQKSSDSKKVRALEACQACKTCQWTNAGTKGCQQCLGQFYSQMRLTKFNLHFYQCITEPATSTQSDGRQ